MKRRNIDQEIEVLKRRHGRAFGKFKSGYLRKIKRLERLRTKLRTSTQLKPTDDSESKDYFGE